MKVGGTTLARWLSWLESCPIHQKVVGSIPTQGTYLGCRFDPPLGLMFLSLTSSLSLKKKPLRWGLKTNWEKQKITVVWKLRQMKIKLTSEISKKSAHLRFHITSFRDLVHQPPWGGTAGAVSAQRPNQDRTRAASILFSGAPRRQIFVPVSLFVFRRRWSSGFWISGFPASYVTRLHCCFHSHVFYATKSIFLPVDLSWQDKCTCLERW